MGVKQSQVRRQNVTQLSSSLQAIPLAYGHNMLCPLHFTTSPPQSEQLTTASCLSSNRPGVHVDLLVGGEFVNLDAHGFELERRDLLIDLIGN